MRSPRANMPHFKILIIGAGVAGLSAAISLRRQGHTITVLERHPGCQALGGSVGISANATRVLIDYGMGEIMAKKDARGSNTVHQRRYDTGEILGSRTNDQTVQTYGYPGWTLARYRLQETLAQVAEQRGVTILFSRLVVGVDQDRPAVELKDGTIIEGDLIIGADGIRSILRNAVEGGEPIKSISPFSAYNIDIPRSLLAADPSLSHLLDESNFWLGPSQIVVGINMPDHGDKMNLCLVSEEQEGKEGEWYLHGDLERVKAKYAHFAPSVRKMLDLAKPEDTYIWRFSDLPPLKRWVSESGKIVLVGDAVHAMLPYTGMGASQCIEDSACLAICLEHAESASDFPKVFGAYEAIRKPRTNWLIQKGRDNAHMWHLPDGEEQRRRDDFLGTSPLGIPGKAWDGKNIDDPPEGRFNPLAFAYMQGYDISDYTRRRLKDLLA